MQRYRLYVDESGDHTYGHSSDPNRRYLGLTGVLVSDDYYRSTLHPALETLKAKHFPTHPDNPPTILVRRAIIDRKGVFGRLSNPTAEAAWCADLLQFLSEMKVTLFTVVIDKYYHHVVYGDSAFHPYHYCMTVLVERLRGHLQHFGGQADVMAEARGGNEDKLLAAAYRNVVENGTGYISGPEFQRVITSKELKLKWKDNNITGLQIADLLAAPSRLAILAERGKTLSVAPSAFTQKINTLVRPKFNPYGRVFLGG